MRGLIVAALLLISAGCGEDDGPTASGADDAGADDGSGDDGGPSYEDAAVESVCKTQAVYTEASSRITAALCLAMSEPGEFGCDYREGDDAVVLCTGLAGTIVVEFDDAELGTAHYATAKVDLGTIDDALHLTLTAGKTGVCTVNGEVAELCVR